MPKTRGGRRSRGQVGGRGRRSAGRGQPLAPVGDDSSQQPGHLTEQDDSGAGTLPSGDSSVADLTVDNLIVVIRGEIHRSSTSNPGGTDPQPRVVDNATPPQQTPPLPPLPVPVSAQSSSSGQSNLDCNYVANSVHTCNVCVDACAYASRVC